MTTRPKLCALADRLGVIPQYLNYNATRNCKTSDETNESLVRAMGFDAPDEVSAVRLLEALESEERGRFLDRVNVRSAGVAAPPTIRLRTGAPAGAEIAWSLELALDAGEVRRSRGLAASGNDAGEIEITLPWTLEPGCHRLAVSVKSVRGELRGEQFLVLAPDRCATVAERSGGAQLRGLWTNLYSLRSRDNWGVGDFGDLRRLIEWSADVGLAFIGLNPLHALRNRGADVSPYRPISRLFRNEIYLDLPMIPEFAECPEAQKMLESSAVRAQLSRLRESDVIDYDAVQTLRRALLRSLHSAFLAGNLRPGTQRARAYESYLQRQGQALLDFATFAALDEHFRSITPPVHDWRDWPGPLRAPRSPEVEQFRRDHAVEVGFHCYVQFELDRQLMELARLACEKGLRIGLFQDLAIGTAPDGCDPWAFPGLFVEGVSVGAPPDDLGPSGQNWALPPINPHRLRESSFEYWRCLLRNAFAHAGALRIDHVMGLLRQFWIPQGRDGTAGAYVRFPADELFAILALESRRSGALVIGEDLGTVPDGFSKLLERWGALSTRVLYFERDYRGDFLPPQHYSDRAYSVVATHDMVPLAGFREGRDLLRRRSVGAIQDDAALGEAQARRLSDYDALVRRLQSEGLLSDGVEVDRLLLCAALNAFLRRTPSPLVGISLDDLAGESEPVNLPGIGQDRYPNWSRRMKTPLEEICTSAEIHRMIGVVGR